MSLNYVLKLFIWEQNTKYYIAVCTYINQYVSGYTSLIQLFNSSFYLIFTESIITSALQCICSWMLAYLKFFIQDWPEIKDIICQNKEKICTLDKLHIFLKNLTLWQFSKIKYNNLTCFNSFKMAFIWMQRYWYRNSLSHAE